eukprot:s88_g3.t2
MGLELPTIGFGAFLLLELHATKDDHFVKIYFNSTPCAGDESYAKLRPLLLPLGEDCPCKTLQQLPTTKRSSTSSEEKLVRTDRCRHGSIPLKALFLHGDIPLIEETFQSFMDLCSAAAAQPTRQKFSELFAEGRHQWMSLAQWRDRYAQAFQFFDTDNDGQLSREEVLGALAEWGYSETVDTLFLLVDSDPDTAKLDEEGLYLTMAALVGIRGGLHSQVAISASAGAEKMKVVYTLWFEVKDATKPRSRNERKKALEEERKKRKDAKGEGRGKSGVRICIRNLSEAMTAEKLRELFEPLGTIVAVILKCDEETGKNRGVGFVVMSSMEEATKAIEELNGKEAEGKPLNVALSERRRRGERADGGEGGGGGKGKGEGGKGKGKGKGGKDQSSFAGGMHPGPGKAPAMGPGFPGFPKMPMFPGMGYLPPRPGPGGLPGLPAGFPGYVAPAAGRPPAHMPGMRPPMPFPQQGLPGMLPGMPPMFGGMPRPPNFPQGPYGATPPVAAPPAALNKEALQKLPAQQQKQQLGEQLYAQNYRRISRFVDACLAPLMQQVRMQVYLLSVFLPLPFRLASETRGYRSIEISSNDIGDLLRMSGCRVVLWRARRVSVTRSAASVVLGCNPGFDLWVDGCFLPCPAGQYRYGYDCLECPPNCDVCVGGLAHECQVCSPGYIFDFRGLCVRECNRGRYAPANDRTRCDECDAYCRECIAGTRISCSSCYSGYTLRILDANTNTGECMQDCRKGFFRDSPNDLKLGSPWAVLSQGLGAAARACGQADWHDAGVAECGDLGAPGVGREAEAQDRRSSEGTGQTEEVKHVGSRTSMGGCSPEWTVPTRGRAVREAPERGVSPALAPAATALAAGVVAKRRSSGLRRGHVARGVRSKANPERPVRAEELMEQRVDEAEMEQNLAYLDAKASRDPFLKAMKPMKRRADLASEPADMENQRQNFQGKRERTVRALMQSFLRMQLTLVVILGCLDVNKASAQHPPHTGTMRPELDRMHTVGGVRVEQALEKVAANVRAQSSRAGVAPDMPPGGGVSITSINRETDLDEMIEEVKRRKEAGMPSLGKASMVDYELCKSRDEAQRMARPHLFFDSQKHVDKVRAKLAENPDFKVMYNPSVSMNDHSVSTIAKSVAGSSTFVDLLKRQYGQV